MNLYMDAHETFRVAAIVPTYNAGLAFPSFLDALSNQNYPLDIVVVDSSSKDETRSVAQQYGISVIEISNESFNHGGTRQMAIDSLVDIDIAVLLTQDAALADADSIKNILEHFHDSRVAAVCGRQLPRKQAGLIEAHARHFNYPAKSYTRSIQDVDKFGLKTAFISNSFAAYRVAVLKEVGGFPENVIFGEDMYVATKMLKAGYYVAYSADACVYHSHDYSLWQEMERYFDMGVLHAREPWIREEFGGAEGEGIKFVISEYKYLLKHAFWYVPEGVLRTLFRYAGFRLGLIEKRLPLWLKRTLAMNKRLF